MMSLLPRYIKDNRYMIVIKLKLAGRILLFFLFISGTLNAQLPIIQTKFTADPAPLVYKDKV